MPKTAAKARKRSTSPYVAPPVQRAVKLLRHIAEGDPVVNMSETAQALKINRTTLLRLLHTFELEGFIERRPGGQGYQIGRSLLGMATRAFYSQDVVQIALPILTTLAETLRLSAHFGVLDGTDVLYLLRKTPSNTLLTSNIRVGSRLPAHATTMGRIILAHMSKAEVDEIFAGKDMSRFSDKTATSLKDLHATLARDRVEGVAWSTGNFEPGIGSAATVVFDIAGRPIGAINVSGPVDAFVEAKRENIGRELKAVGIEISQRLGWIAPPPHKVA